MRIVFVISSLGMGGSERVAVNLCNHWSHTGHQVTLVTLASQEGDFYSVEPQVVRIPLGLARDSRSPIDFLSSNLKRIWSLRCVIRSAAPDVVVSFEDTTNVRSILAGFGIRVPLVVAERTDPRVRALGKVVTFLRPLLYRRAQALVVQTKSCAAWARAIVPSGAVHVIPNAVSFPRAVAREAVRHGRPVILAMGRMNEAKGFDLLLRAFALCASRQEQWDLRIVGDGPERSRLNFLAAELRIQDRILLDSATKCPFTALRNADLFVLSSRREGFPNALLEAMACRLAVVSFDCLSGPSEIISHNENGLLVPAGDVEGLAAAMDQLMSSNSERQRLGKNAAQVIDEYRPERIFELWDSLLVGMVDRKLAA